MPAALLADAHPDTQFLKGPARGLPGDRSRQEGPGSGRRRAENDRFGTPPDGVDTAGGLQMPVVVRG